MCCAYRVNVLRSGQLESVHRGAVLSAGPGSIAVRTDDQQTLNLGVGDHTAIILDGRNVLPRAALERAGFRYTGVGR